MQILIKWVTQCRLFRMFALSPGWGGNFSCRASVIFVLSPGVGCRSCAVGGLKPPTGKNTSILCRDVNGSSMTPSWFVLLCSCFSPSVFLRGSRVICVWQSAQNTWRIFDWFGLFGCIFQCVYRPAVPLLPYVHRQLFIIAVGADCHFLWFVLCRHASVQLGKCHCYASSNLFVQGSRFLLSCLWFIFTFSLFLASDAVHSNCSYLAIIKSSIAVMFPDTAIILNSCCFNWVNEAFFCRKSFTVHCQCNRSCVCSTLLHSIIYFTHSIL